MPREIGIMANVKPGSQLAFQNIAPKANNTTI